MKKLLALMLAMVMVVAFVACTPAAPEAETTEPTETETTEPAAEMFKIGMVTDVGGVNDKSFNETSWEGLQRLAADNANVEVNYLESKTDADYQTNIETFVDEEYDLIICVGFMLQDATQAAAEAYPDQKFAIVDSFVDLPNVASLGFAQHEASYLVGIIAGMVTESNTVGYVQGMVFDVMNEFGVGFISGVKSVNPDAEILQFNANNFGDATIGSTAATDMITRGADVIYHAAGGTGNGVIEAAQTNDIYAIGVDKDQSSLAPEHVISSAMKRVDNACYEVSMQVVNGEFAGGSLYFDLTNEGVGIAPSQDLIPADVLAAVDEATAAIIAGDVVVPKMVSDLEDPSLFTLE